MKRRYEVQPVAVGERLERFAAPRRLAYLAQLILAAMVGVGFFELLHALWRLV